MTLPTALQLRPVPASARVWLYVLVLALPLLLIGSGLLAGVGELDGRGLALLLAFVIGVLATVAVTLDLVLRRHRLSLEAGRLEVVSTFFHQRFALADLDLGRARVVDLAEHTALKPMLKTNGVSLPGIHSGWFRLRNWTRAFVAMADGGRVLHLPTRRGFDLLLQPGQPQALLERLREMDSASPSR